MWVAFSFREDIIQGKQKVKWFFLPSFWKEYELLNAISNWADELDQSQPIYTKDGIIRHRDEYTLVGVIDFPSDLIIDQGEYLIFDTDSFYDYYSRREA